jgi:release factor glutamine methyltransferase
MSIFRIIPTITALLAEATDNLSECSDSARLDAEILLAFVLDVPRSYLYAHADEKPEQERCDIFIGMVQRRIQGEPVAYITGRREFWSMDLVVNRHTLIPRPETEILVEQALACLPESTPRVLDLGTGSGAVALALAKERPDSTVIGTDLFAETLAVARYNAARLEIPNVEFRQGNWFAPVTGLVFDVIVSNPPYVAKGDPHLLEEGLPYEPEVALVSGADGLEAIRELASRGPQHLAEGGSLWIEHGYDQADAVAAILRDAGLRGVATLSDFAGIARVTGGLR